jgi:hypothetical protein
LLVTLFLLPLYFFFYTPDTRLHTCSYTPHLLVAMPPHLARHSHLLQQSSVAAVAAEKERERERERHTHTIRAGAARFMTSL